MVIKGQKLQTISIPALHSEATKKSETNLKQRENKLFQDIHILTKRKQKVLTSIFHYQNKNFPENSKLDLGIMIL